VLERPDDLEARARMQLGAAFAGVAIENSMLGAAHSCANPLTARYNVVHGQAVGLMIRGVMRFNAALPEVEQVYRDLAADAGLGSVEELISGFDAILEQSGLKAKLSNLGLAYDGVAVLAEEASRQWTAQFNPRTIGAEDFARLFEEVL
jgi:alcohol dehydrogenase